MKISGAELSNCPATIEDLYRTEGKAELINGEIVHHLPDGAMPGIATDEIFVSLRLFIRQNGLSGRSISSTAVFLVNLPYRRSFSASVSYYEGRKFGMKFFEDAPRFAVEVRNSWDRGDPIELAMATKRSDYFAAGTQVAWDVDLENRDVVRKYRADAPGIPEVFRRGEIANAEPAVPGWTMPVDDLFDDA